MKPETDPHKYSQPSVDKDTKAQWRKMNLAQWRRMNLFQQKMLEPLDMHMQKIEPRHKPYIFQNS